MIISCLDLEGVLVPEIWIVVSKKTGIKELSLTTRDEPDYDKLMRRRLGILKTHRIKLRDIQSVISKIELLSGAKAFLDKLRAARQVVILSDTYYEFAMPLIKKLGYPMLWCNWLVVDSKGYIADYHLRQKNGKEKSVRGLRNLGYRVYAAGDSYNDLAMLKAADKGILFRPPVNIAKEFSKFKIAQNYAGLLKFFV